MVAATGMDGATLKKSRYFKIENVMRKFKTNQVTRWTWAGVFMIGIAGISTQASVTVEHHINWPEFLAAYDLNWSDVPKDRASSAFIGNGMIGSTIWSAREETIHWDLGRNDVYDTAPNSYRMPIGKLILNLKGTPKRFQMCQSLYQAQVTGSIVTDRGNYQWRSMIPHDRMVGLIEYTLSGDEELLFTFNQLPAVNSNALRNTLREHIADKPIPAKARKIVDFSDPVYAPYLAELSRNKDLFRNSAANRGTTDTVHWLTQSFQEGGGYTVAWDTKYLGQDKFMCAYTIDFVREGVPTAKTAVERVQDALQTSYDTMHRSHQQWWASFYNQSFLSVPDPAVMRYYWLQIYKIGSATRKDGVILDQIGPWLRATAWARVWNNINVQIAYMSMMTCNHLELCQPFIDLFSNNKENLAQAVPETYRTKGALALGRTMDIYGRTGWDYEFGNLTWALHDYWTYCRYTGDETRLRRIFYPLLKGAAIFMINALKKDDQGLYHLPPDVSPEYPKKDLVADTTYNLALLRWNLKTLQYLNSHYRLNDPDAGQWEDILAHLIPYPIDANGLMVGSDTPFAATHRHYSHLLPFYPLRELDPESMDGRALFRKSYDHWVTLAGDRRAGWNHFSFFGAAGMAAWLRDGDRALTHLKGGFNKATFSTFFPGPGPAIESMICALIAIGEMHLQSATTNPADYRMRIFPALPSAWQNVCFDKLRAQGAFEVSARKRNGDLEFVQIKSLAGNPCCIEVSFNGLFQVHGHRSYTTNTQTLDSGCSLVTVDLQKDETVWLISEKALSRKSPLHISPVGS